MSRKRLTKAQRLAVMKRLKEDYGPQESEEKVIRCERCGAIFRHDLQTLGIALLFMVGRLLKPEEPEPLLCLNCKAYEFAKKKAAGEKPTDGS